MHFYQQIQILVQGSSNLTFNTKCIYCFQLDDSLHVCTSNQTCDSTRNEFYISTCRIVNDVFCMGDREFEKVVKCNFSSGYKWSTTLLLRYFNFTLNSFLIVLASFWVVLERTDFIQVMLVGVFSNYCLLAVWVCGQQQTLS